jgi:hypothetical protein
MNAARRHRSEQRRLLGLRRAPVYHMAVVGIYALASGAPSDRDQARKVFEDARALTNPQGKAS